MSTNQGILAGNILITSFIADPGAAFLRSSTPAVPAGVTTWYPLGVTSAKDLQFISCIIQLFWFSQALVTL